MINLAITDRKIIQQIPVRAFRAAQVNKDLIMMSILTEKLKQVVPDSLKKKVTDKNLAIFDTKTDAFIQVIPGDFGPIGWNKFMFMN